MHVAVKHGLPVVIKYLINVCKLSPNKTNQNSLTPLDVAFIFGKMDVAEYLIKEFPGIFTCKDAPVDLLWTTNTALHVAGEHGSLIVVKYLINDCKLDPYKINCNF